MLALVVQQQGDAHLRVDTLQPQGDALLDFRQRQAGEQVVEDIAAGLLQLLRLVVVVDVGQGTLDLAIEAGAQLHLHPAMTLHRQPQPHHAVPVQALTRGEFRHQLAQSGAVLGMESLIQGMV